MGGFIAFLFSLQSTLGPSNFLNEQQLLPDTGLEVMASTLYAPTVVVSELIPPVGSAIQKTQMAYREIFPSSCAGVTLPSPYYLSDDIQYFPPGPERKVRTERQILREAQARLPK